MSPAPPTARKPLKALLLGSVICDRASFEICQCLIER